MTTAAMASSSYPDPSAGWAEFRREPMMTPASPLKIPHSA